MNLEGKTFLVTGGAGFIGSHTARALLDKGARVVVVDNLISGEGCELPENITFYKLDLADQGLSEIFDKEKPEYVYHFAFNVLVPQSMKDPLMDAHSVLASLNLIANSHRFGIKKIIFSSSGFVYGNKNETPTSEEGVIDHITPYIVSKHSVENYLRYYNLIHGLPHVTLRYGTVYGPGQTKGAMADYIRKLKSGEQADIWGDGKKTRDYTYIDDIVEANILALNVPDDHENPIFNVSFGKETSLHELYCLIATLLNKTANPNLHPDRSGELMRNCLNSSKIKKTLSWEPKVELKDGLSRTISYLEGLKNAEILLGHDSKIAV